MKRVLCLLEIVCLIATLFVGTVSGFADVLPDCTKAITMLEYIGAYTTPENSEELTLPMTRAKFAEIVAKVIKANESDTNVYYQDVPRENIYVSYINALREAGFVSSQEIYFRPDDAITYAEAAKILLSVAGYDVYANAKGGFPTGYVLTAGRLEILNECADENALKSAEALLMIYNAFSMGMYEISSLGGDLDLTYQIGSESVFSIYHKIYIAKAQLLACNTATADGQLLKENQVLLSGEIYDIDPNICADGFFLNTVEYFYQEQSDVVSYVFYMENAASTVKQDLVISGQDLIGFNPANYLISYYIGDNSRTISLLRNTVVYYNGKEYTGSLSTALDEFITGARKGSLRIKDMDGDGRYDALIIKCYRNIVVNQVDTQTGTYYNMADFSDSIQIEQYDGISVRNSQNEAIKLDVLTPAVLQVAESKDKSLIDIIICTDKINGTVESVNKREDETVVSVDGKTFKIDKTYASTLPEFIVGNAYTVILDTYGYAAYAAVGEKSGYQIGLLVNCVSNMEGFSRNVTFKIYENGAGGVKEFVCADTVKIDGKTYRLNKDNPIFAIPGGDGNNQTGGANVEQQAIRYKTNEDGQIVEIDTYIVSDAEDKNNSLTKLSGPWGFNRYFNRYSRLGTSALRDHDNTIMFAKPRTDKNGYLLSYDKGTGQNYPDDYVLDENGNKIMSDDTMFYNEYLIRLEEWALLDVYKFNPNTTYADIMVHTYESYHLSTDCFVFESCGEMLNATGDSVPMVTCYKAAEKKEYPLFSAELGIVSTLQRGDLFRCSINEKTGEMRGIQLVYDCSDDAFYDESGKKREYTVNGDAIQSIVPDFWYTGQISIQTSTNKVTSFDFYREFQLTKGDVAKKLGKALYIDWDGNYDTLEEVVDFTNLPLVVIDTTIQNEKAIYSAQPETIADYQSAGPGCAKIDVHNAWMTPKCGYVYLR